MTQPPQGGPPGPPPPPGGSDPNRPGSRAWVEQRYGSSAAFTDRIIPGILDALLAAVSAFIPLVLGVVLIIAGLPDTYDCALWGENSCTVPGTGSGVLVALGISMFFLSVLASFAMIAWNRVWRVTRTGQSLGKKFAGLRVVDAETGEHPQLGPAALRELVHQVAGIISWIWMLIDDDDRTLADIVGKTHVILLDKR